MPASPSLLLKASVFTVTFLFSQPSFAQIVEHNGYLSAVSSPAGGIDSLSVIPKTTASLAAGLRGSMEHVRLLNYLTDLGVPDQQYKYQSGKKFYYHLANVFARLRLYPLAMKCFFKAVRVNGSGMDSLQLSAVGSNPQDGALAVSLKDDAIVGKRALVVRAKRTSKKSKRTSFQQIISNFNDGKTAVAYALLFHVKQPAPGKRKIFVWVNTGHTFITLIKYNADSTYASASFGFYPDKDQVLSATPIAPTTSATFKDDAGHLWDEVLGKFISRRNFENILELTRKFEGMTYNLNQQNCTDFGLQAASLAGIHITDTFGKWPLGRGNNPAVTGQSILKGRISNEAKTTQEQLFMDQTVDCQEADYDFDD
ncbi:hypothetical protein [Pedobacter hartonius]|uniref:DUF4105 domain-containing protein n=1 Tax=Pedobacter hartonius TaxID=425514 RepID=A0A1H4GK55_9SPHI|nr:hypothetical protein [Pedobacter hartonius]SEB10013.1 hypothetical protein SAMN05443550_110139 [Pedobacter hartonius]